MAFFRNFSVTFRNFAVLALLGAQFEGCGVGLGRETALTPGVTTQAEIEHTLAAPADTHPAAGRTDAKMLSFKGARCRYQFVVGNVHLDARICSVDPLRGENTLQFWRHLWKGQHTQIQRLKADRAGHTTPWTLFRNLDSGQSALFDAASGRVIALVEKAAVKATR